MDRRAPASAQRRTVPNMIDSEPDTCIGEFVRGKEIGKGSFATVYLASHRVRNITAGLVGRSYTNKY